MYTEFVWIFIGLGIAIALLIAILVLIIVHMRKASNDIPMNSFVAQKPQTPIYGGATNTNSASATNTGAASSGVVFCKNCFTQFDSTAQFCPKCGTPKSN